MLSKSFIWATGLVFLVVLSSMSMKFVILALRTLLLVTCLSCLALDEIKDAASVSANPA